MKNILVTGGNGLIGYELLNQLSKIENYIIYNATRTTQSNQSFNNIIFINLDLNDPNFTDLLPKKIDIIFHFAQSEFFRSFPEKAIELYKVNTLSTLYLLDYAKTAGCDKFFYASTGGIYGHGIESFSEDNNIIYKSDIGFYQSTKFNSEILIENYSQYFNTVILRFFFVYGKRQKPDMLIPRIIEKIKQGAYISLTGDMGIKINPIYVDDAVSAILNCLNLTGNYKINIAGNEVLSIKEITTIIGSHLNKNPKYEIIHSDINKDLIANIDKMKNLLNYTPKCFTEQIKNML